MKSPADFARDLADEFRERPHLFEVDVDFDGDVTGAELSREGIDAVERIIKLAIAEDRQCRSAA
jgi:hypothetical protein